MNKKIIGNWNNEYAARFNALLGATIILLACLSIDFIFRSFGDVLVIILFSLTNLLQMIAAYYFFKNHEKYKEYENEI